MDKWKLPLNWNKSLLSRLLVSYVLLIMVPVSIIGLLSFKSSEKLLSAQISRSNANTLEQIDKNISVLLDQVTAIVNIYDMNKELEGLLRKKYDNLYDELIDKGAVESSMLRYSFSFDWLNFQSLLLGDNGLIYTHNYEGGRPNEERLRATDWRGLLHADPDKIAWVGPHHSFFGQQDTFAFTAAKLLRTNFTDREYGVFLLSVKEQNLYDIYRNVVADGHEVFIMDRNRTILSSSRRDTIGQTADAALYASVLDSREPYKVTTVNREKVLTLYTKISRVDWYIVENIPLDSVMKDTNLLKRIISLTSLLCVVFSVGAAVFISRRISMPLIRLSRRIQGYPRQSPAPAEDNVKVNEIVLLTTEYDKLINRLERTVRDLIRNQEEKRDAELKALQAQINPHFLYNTLNSIKCLVWVKKTELIEPTINALVNLLEKTIHRQDAYISLKDELECVENYIFIQQIRTFDTISVHYEVDETLLDCQVPKLLLQPIVENAVFHGLEPKNEQGVISLTCTAAGGDIRIEISDNGMGMEEETAAALFGDSPAATRTSYRFNGIGVRNVDERLKMNYGPEYGLHIRSERGQGTTVTLTLPQIRAKRESDHD